MQNFYFIGKNIYMNIYLVLVYIFFLSVFRVNFFLDRIRFLLRVLSLLIGIFIVITGKIYYINYFIFFAKNCLFMVMVFIIYFCFFTKDFLSFYLLFEFSVIPIFLYIMAWGSSFDRIKASVFLFFYTYFSSLIFLIFLMKFYVEFKSLEFVFLNYSIFFWV